MYQAKENSCGGTHATKKKTQCSTGRMKYRLLRRLDVLMMKMTGLHGNISLVVRGGVNDAATSCF